MNKLAVSQEEINTVGKFLGDACHQVSEMAGKPYTVVSVEMTHYRPDAIKTRWGIYSEKSGQYAYADTLEHAFQEQNEMINGPGFDRMIEELEDQITELKNKRDTLIKERHEKALGLTPDVHNSVPTTCEPATV
jgi:hypothetical protein